MRLPAAVWLLGLGGLFGYHAAYFTALRHAPVVEAGLIAFLWPLLIVVFSALSQGDRLRAHHLLSTGLGFAGAVLLIGYCGLSFEARYGAGYGAAVACALI